MNSGFRVYSVSLMSFVLLSAAFSVVAQTPVSLNPVLNQPTEHEIKGGETQFYILNIGANQTARVEIDHKGVDVALVAFKPGGEKFWRSKQAWLIRAR